jgi:hypothetical protein
MEWKNEVRVRRVLVSSQDPAHLKTVIAMLHAHGIQTEEGLHRPWHSAAFESSVLVSPEDYPEASVLYKESGIPAEIEPTLLPNLASSRRTERGKGELSSDFVAKPKQPEPTDFGRYLKNRASL